MATGYSPGFVRKIQKKVRLYPGNPQWRRLAAAINRQKGAGTVEVPPKPQPEVTKTESFKRAQRERAVLRGVAKGLKRDDLTPQNRAALEAARRRVERERLGRAIAKARREGKVLVVGAGEDVTPELLAKRAREEAELRRVSAVLEEKRAARALAAQRGRLVVRESPPAPYRGGSVQASYRPATLQEAAAYQSGGVSDFVPGGRFYSPPAREAAAVVAASPPGVTVSSRSKSPSGTVTRNRFGELQVNTPSDVDRLLNREVSDELVQFGRSFYRGGEKVGRFPALLAARFAGGFRDPDKIPAREALRTSADFFADPDVRLLGETAAITVAAAAQPQIVTGIFAASASLDVLRGDTRSAVLKAAPLLIPAPSSIAPKSSVPVRLRVRGGEFPSSRIVEPVLRTDRFGNVYESADVLSLREAGVSGQLRFGSSVSRPGLSRSSVVRGADVVVEQVGVTGEVFVPRVVDGSVRFVDPFAQPTRPLVSRETVVLERSSGRIFRLRDSDISVTSDGVFFRAGRPEFRESAGFDVLQSVPPRPDLVPRAAVPSRQTTLSEFVPESIIPVLNRRVTVVPPPVAPGRGSSFLPSEAPPVRVSSSPGAGTARASSGATITSVVTQRPPLQVLAEDYGLASVRPTFREIPLSGASVGGRTSINAFVPSSPVSSALRPVFPVFSGVSESPQIIDSSRSVVSRELSGSFFREVSRDELRFSPASALSSDVGLRPSQVQGQFLDQSAIVSSRVVQDQAVSQRVSEVGARVEGRLRLSEGLALKLARPAARARPLFGEFSRGGSRVRLSDDDDDDEGVLSGGRFGVLVRRRGVFRQLGSFGSLDSASAALRSALSSSAAASGKIVGRGSARAVASLARSPQFRTSKLDSDVLVQRRRFRISSPGEKAEISRRGLAVLSARRRRRKLF